MEFLLVNHPLDCPVCDKGGECPLQNQAMSHGRGESRFTEVKRHVPQADVKVSAQVLLDRERCVLCARCTRFSEQIAGDPFIALLERGPEQQVGIADGRAVPLLLLRQHHPDLPGRRPHQRRLPVPVAPVRPRLDAVRRRARRLRLGHPRRPPARQGHAPARRRRPRGQRGVDHRQGPLLLHLDDARTTACATPLVRNEDRRAGAGLVAGRAGRRRPRAGRRRRRGRRAARRPPDRRGRLRLQHVRAHGAAHQRHRLPRPRALRRGGRLPGRPRRRHAPRPSRTATSRRRRPSSSSGWSPRTRPARSSCGCARRRASGLKVVAVGRARHPRAHQDGRRAGRRPCPARRPPRSTRSTLGAGDAVVILAGERLAGVAGGFSAALASRRAHRARSSPGCRVAPATAVRSRPAACPPCCPGGRPVADAEARADLAAAWGVESLPARAGRDTARDHQGRRRAQARRPRRRRRRDRRPARSRRAPARRSRPPFVVSLEVRESDVTRAADVVLPVAPVVEKAGTFVNWEGRLRPFDAVLDEPSIAHRHPRPRRHRRGDGVRPRLPHRRRGARAAMTETGPWDGTRTAAPHVDAPAAPKPAKGTRRARDLAAADRRRPRPGRPAAVPRHRPPGRAARQRSDAGRGRHRARRPRHHQHRRTAAPPSRPRSPTCPTASSGRRPTTAPNLRRLGAGHGTDVALDAEGGRAA